MDSKGPQKKHPEGNRKAYMLRIGLNYDYDLKELIIHRTNEKITQHMINAILYFHNILKIK